MAELRHIKVELDFIPVEERLPAETGFYMARVQAQSEKYRRPGKPFNVCWTGHVWDTLGIVTHWAEIPEIKK